MQPESAFWQSKFQSTPLMRGETFTIIHKRNLRKFQSTPLMRGETSFSRQNSYTTQISIHSPHARGDFLDRVIIGAASNFNPLPSCEGRRLRGDNEKYRFGDFNPLPSCEGRPRRAETLPRSSSISIHSPHARGDGVARGRALEAQISIHSPHARGDPGTTGPQGPQGEFQSTPLMRGETDALSVFKFTLPFQSTPLMRGETHGIAHLDECSAFQSTPLMRGETRHTLTL